MSTFIYYTNSSTISTAIGQQFDTNVTTRVQKVLLTSDSEFIVLGGGIQSWMGSGLSCDINRQSSV